MERVEQTKFGAPRMWRNASVRRLVWLLAVCLACAALFVWLYTVDSEHRLRQDWLAQQTAVIGQLSAADPELARQWAGLLAHPERLTEKDAAAGRAIAAEYGLTAELGNRLSPVLQTYWRRSASVLIVAVALAFVILAAVLIREYRRQFSDIRKLAVSLEDTVKHNRTMAFRLYDEGEIGLLASSVQELAIRLQETIGQLHRDKDFLKNTVADISHQLKTPLASLIIYVDLLREGNVDAARTAEFLGTCRRELERMEWLILTLLKIARLEADALTLQIQPSKAADTVKRAVDSVRRLADERGVGIAVEGPSAEGEMQVPHDPRWLGEAIGNLIKNAIEHSPAGGVVTIAWTASPVFLRLYVEDQGSGIEEKHLPHIFHKFYRASARGTGVGLGLALAKSIVERHGGMLAAGPGAERGARFVLTLPLHPLPTDDFSSAYESVSTGTVEL